MGESNTETINENQEVSLPDFYKDEKSLLEDRHKSINTNDRYPSFKQRYKTVGDEEQFYMFLKDQLYNRGYVKCGSSEYSFQDVYNTFSYIFNKFKKGIFVRIKDNHIETFLPFSKINFVNEYAEKYSVDPKEFSSFDELFDTVRERLGISYKQQINPKIFWYANNGIFRYEVSRIEIDPCTNVIHDMLIETCKNRVINDCEFFINRRDFPILTKNGTEPYEHIWGENHPLVSHSYNRYIPILSMTTSDDNRDIAIPTWEDWSRASTLEDEKLFPFSYNQEFGGVQFSDDWESKKPIAVFRGSSTGVGYNIKTNPRIKLAWMDKQNKTNDNGERYIDAGITKWNIRPRKHVSSEYVKLIDKDLINKIGTKGYLSYKEQSEYKYIINIAGHVSSFRLGQLFRTNSVVLYAKTKYKLWYDNALIPYKHYVPIKEDLSDLYEKIDWCRANEKQCVSITENAKLFFEEKLSSSAQMDFLEKKLNLISHLTGNIWYPNLSQVEYQIKWEKEMVPEITNIEFDNFEDIYSSRKTTLKSMKRTGKSDIIIKEPINNNILENIHECFVYNNGLKRVQSPNFRRIHGLYERDGKNVIMMDKIEGVSLFEYITDKSKKFFFTEFCSILMQLSLAYEIAYEQCGFIHYDANPWNVILYRYKQHKNVTYKTSSGTYKIYTDCVPIIIDYGKSYIISPSGTQHGYVNTFGKHERTRDMFTLTTSCLYLVLSNRKLEGYDTRKIVSIYNRMFTTMKGNLTMIKKVLYGIKKYDIVSSLDPNRFIQDEQKKFKSSLDYFKMFSYVSKLYFKEDLSKKLFYQVCDKPVYGEWFISNPSRTNDIVKDNPMYKELSNIIEKDHSIGSIPKHIYNI